MKVSAGSEALVGIRIQLLGNLRVRRGGRDTVLPASKRTRALLGYLVATGRPHTRQHLCDLLWDGPDDPRAALRWSLTKLRPVVNAGEATGIQADREYVRFVPHESFVDIARIDQLLAVGVDQVSVEELDEAAVLLQGEFLDGLDLPHCYRFHHWCMTERERFGRLRRQVLERLIDYPHSDPERSLGYARTLVAVDPLSEAAHGKLVSLLASAGRLRDADIHYEYARDLLYRELDAPLSGELTRPVASARAEVPAPTNERKDISEEEGGVHRPLRLPRIPIIGRYAELQAIEASIKSLSEGATTKILLFTGEPGIGKSRLLEAVADAAAQAGSNMAAGRCFEAEMIRPYGLWIDALGSVANPGFSSFEVAALKPLSRPGISGQDRSREQLFEEIVTVLTNMAERRPLVVLLDDLQWIDEGSASLLHYLVRTTKTFRRILFAAAAREGEIDDNPWARRLLASLDRNQLIDQFSVGPLTIPETAALFEDRLSDREAAEAHRSCGGNPLFALEIARRKRNRQQLAGGEFRTLIADRIDRLDDAARELVRFGSAIGRAFSAELVSRAIDRSEMLVQADIDRLEERGLLRSLPDGQHDFVHDLVCQVTYQTLAQPRRRMIHKRLALALSEAARLDESLFGDLAHHAGLAQNHVLAAEACVAAGERCLRLFANTEAELAADRGLAQLDHVATATVRLGLQISLLGIKAFAALGAKFVRPQLEDELRDAVNQAEALGLHSLARLGCHHLAWITQRKNNTGGVRAAILQAEALSRTSDNDPVRCRQLANTGRCLLEIEQDVERAREFLDEAERLAATLNLRVIELDWGKALTARWDGDLDAAHAMTSRAIELARLREDRWRELECLVWLAKIDLERGRLQDVGVDCECITDVIRRISDLRAPIGEALGALAHYKQADASAQRKLDNALMRLRAFDDKANLAYVLNEYAAAQLQRGDYDHARILAQESQAAAGAVRRTTELAVSNALLLSASVAAGDDASSSTHLAQLSSLGNGQPLSARAKTFLNSAYERRPR